MKTFKNYCIYIVVFTNLNTEGEFRDCWVRFEEVTGQLRSEHKRRDTQIWREGIPGRGPFGTRAKALSAFYVMGQVNHVTHRCPVHSDRAKWWTCDLCNHRSPELLWQGQDRMGLSPGLQILGVISVRDHVVGWEGLSNNKVSPRTKEKSL